MGVFYLFVESGSCASMSGSGFRLWFFKWLSEMVKRNQLGPVCGYWTRPGTCRWWGETGGRSLCRPTGHQEPPILGEVVWRRHPKHKWAGVSGGGCEAAPKALGERAGNKRRKVCFTKLRCFGVFGVCLEEHLPSRWKLCCLQVSDRVTSLSPSAPLSLASLKTKTCFCPPSTWSSSLKSPGCEAPQGHRSTTGPGTSGSPKLHRSTSSPRMKVSFKGKTAMVNSDPAWKSSSHWTNNLCHINSCFKQVVWILLSCFSNVYCLILLFYILILQLSLIEVNVH